MSNLYREKNDDFDLHLITIDDEQVLITLSVTNKTKNPIYICNDAYREISKILKAYRINIFHERVWGSNSLYEKIRTIRDKKLNIDSEIPFTFIEGSPYWGEGFSGINIHGIILKNETDKIYNISFENKVCGRIWRTNDFEYLLLNGIHGLVSSEDDFYTQSINMFERAKCILLESGFDFYNVLRTWIYLYDILSQYNDFNKARNFKFKEMRLIPNALDDNGFEQIYLPASTGIGGGNIYGAAGNMDVFAVKLKENIDLKIRSHTGEKQKSAYRYGSAFSRAMIIEDQMKKYIYLSGTASINDEGETVYIGDIDKQIDMTFNVIRALIEKEGFGIDQICEATVFVKKAEYVNNFEMYCQKVNLVDIPWIITVADVCRKDLLFEIDAVFMKSKM